MGVLIGSVNTHLHKKRLLTWQASSPIMVISIPNTNVSQNHLIEQGVVEKLFYTDDLRGIDSR